MTPGKITEAAFEAAIEEALLAGGPHAAVSGSGLAAEGSERYGEGVPGGYLRRTPDQYDRERCLIPSDLFDFILATQPASWAKLAKADPDRAREELLQHVARHVEKRGLLDALQRGVKVAGTRFHLAYFRPVSGLNDEQRDLYAGNLFSVVRQLHYSEVTAKDSLDIVVFLNGLPIFTAELKTPLTGQTVKKAIAQYRADRDPAERLFRSGRCLAHFAVDPDQVFVTTRLAGPRTRFLPFNQGRDGGAGNPPVQEGYATSYLWDRVWARDSVLNLIQHFIHESEGDEGQRTLIFPRYHQLDTVRRLVDHARHHGAGSRYLIQHSAGSGKSNSIAWLAHQLSVLHDADDRRRFDSIVVITDRRVLDRQLQETVRQFEKARGVVATIDEGSAQLREALEGGKNIIVTTLQKFPFIVDEMGTLPGQNFAVVIDEAHSSQSGEMQKSLKEVLAAPSLEDAERDDTIEEDVEDRLVAEMKKRGPQPNVSTFAFTATPKPKTLELFGTKRPGAKEHEPFSLYTMRQAIEEGFILDVLENYTTYQTYWKLLKTAESDPRYDKQKATRLLKQFVDIHDHTIRQKVQVVVEHFHQRVSHRIRGRAKAMIVTRSRLHAVRYKLALERELKEQGHDYGALVAFSGTVTDGGHDYTEANMNGVPESQTKAAFERPDQRFLVVANKFQTGFDQPLLHTMYVDKKLGGVNAVQTLSRLNRTHPAKDETMVLDFANDADEIRGAFEPYYERTLLSEGTDPELLVQLQYRIEDYHLFGAEEMDAFAAAYFAADVDQDALYGILKPVVDRFSQLDEDEQRAFRSDVGDYVRLYAFLSQLLTFADAELERLYLFGRYLRRYLPAKQGQLPKEIQSQIDMDSFRLDQTWEGSIELPRGSGKLDPRGEKPPHPATEEEVDALSAIILELNDRFGVGLTDEDRLSLEVLTRRLASDAALQAAASTNTRDNLRLTFEEKAKVLFQDMAKSNFSFYKRATDDQAFGKLLFDLLFEEFLEGKE
ncbi:MAG: type I restriction endonuclease [Longimicrobiales bacterium]